MKTIYLASENKLKINSVKNFSYFKSYNVVPIKTTTSYEQPTQDTVIKCFKERVDESIKHIDKKDDSLIIIFENFINEGEVIEDICLGVFIDLKTNETKKYYSFSIEIDSTLYQLYKKSTFTTFGSYLSYFYPVSKNNWMMNYRFGGVDRTEQFNHILQQYIIDTEYMHIERNLSNERKCVDGYVMNILINSIIETISRNFNKIDAICGFHSRIAPNIAQTMNKKYMHITSDNYDFNEDMDCIFIMTDTKLISDNIVGNVVFPKTGISREIRCIRTDTSTIDRVKTYTQIEYHEMDMFRILHSRKNEEISIYRNDCAMIPCPGTEELSSSIEYYNCKIPTCNTLISHFNNGETRVQIEDNIRCKHVIIICNTRNGVLNDDLMTLFILLDACNRAGVSKITVVLPYYPYSRSDKKEEGRTPIAAAAVARILKLNHVDNVVSLDLHSGQIQGYMDKGFHNLYCINLMCNYLEKFYLHTNRYNYVLISPDAGGVKRVEAYSDKLKLPYITISKRREHNKPGIVSKTTIHGDPDDYNGKIGIMIDDMTDTSGTIVKASKELVNNGLEYVIVVVTHGILSGPALDRINNSSHIKKVIVTNSLPQNNNIRKCSKLQVVDCSKLLADVIMAIINGTSVSALLK